MNEPSLQLLFKRLEALIRASDSLREDIENRIREAGLLQKYVKHNQDAIFDYCRFYQETKTAILEEQRDLSFVVKRIEGMPEISLKSYNRSGSLIRDLKELIFGSPSISLRPFRKKLQSVSEACSSIMFIMKNPALFESESVSKNA